MMSSLVWQFHSRCCPESSGSDFSISRFTRWQEFSFFTERNYESRAVCFGGTFCFWRSEITGRTLTRGRASPIALRGSGIESRRSRKARSARFRSRFERISRNARGFPFHQGARSLGTDGMGPAFVFVSAGDVVGAPRPVFLGYSGVAHGVERERRGNQ